MSMTGLFLVRCALVLVILRLMTIRSASFRGGNWKSFGVEQESPPEGGNSFVGKRMPLVLGRRTAVSVSLFVAAGSPQDTAPVAGFLGECLAAGLIGMPESVADYPYGLNDPSVERVTVAPMTPHTLDTRSTNSPGICCVVRDRSVHQIATALQSPSKDEGAKPARRYVEEERIPGVPRCPETRIPKPPVCLPRNAAGSRMTDRAWAEEYDVVLTTATATAAGGGRSATSCRLRVHARLVRA